MCENDPVCICSVWNSKKTGEAETDKNGKQKRISQIVSYPQMLNTDINLLSFLE